LNDKHRTQKEIWSGYMTTLGRASAEPYLWLWRVIMKLVKRPEKIVPDYKHTPPLPRQFDQFTANLDEIRNILKQMNGRQ
jgi:hypothetical protein